MCGDIFKKRVLFHVLTTIVKEAKTVQQKKSTVLRIKVHLVTIIRCSPPIYTIHEIVRLTAALDHSRSSSFTGNHNFDHFFGNVHLPILHLLHNMVCTWLQEWEETSLVKLHGYTLIYIYTVFRYRWPVPNSSIVMHPGSSRGCVCGEGGIGCRQKWKESMTIFFIYFFAYYKFFTIFFFTFNPLPINISSVRPCTHSVLTSVYHRTLWENRCAIRFLFYYLFIIYYMIIWPPYKYR